MVLPRPKAVRPAVDAASNEIENTRRLPPALLDKLHEAQLFRLLLPRLVQWDRGPIPSPSNHVIETIARADASTAWCLSQAGGCAMGGPPTLDLPVAHADLRQRPAPRCWPGVPVPRSGRSNARVGYKVHRRMVFRFGRARHAHLARRPIARSTPPTARPKRDVNGEQQQRTMLVRTEDVQWNRHLETRSACAGTASDQFALGRTSLFRCRPFDHPRIRSGMPARAAPLYRMGLGHLFTRWGFAGRRLRQLPAAPPSTAFIEPGRATKWARGTKKPATRQCRVVQSNSGPGRSQFCAPRAAYVLQIDGRHLEGARCRRYHHGRAAHQYPDGRDPRHPQGA